MTATALVRSAKRNKDDIREAREVLVKSGRIIETQAGQTKFYEAKPKPIAPSPVTASGAQAMSVGSASSPYMGEATALSDPIAEEKRCSKCGDLVSKPMSTMGMRITMCWNCYEVIEAYLEEPVCPESKLGPESNGIVE